MGNGVVIGPTKLVDHGSTADRWDIVLIAEGYRQEEQAQFAADANFFV